MCICVRCHELVGTVVFCVCVCADTIYSAIAQQLPRARYKHRCSAAMVATDSCCVVHKPSHKSTVPRMVGAVLFERTARLYVMCANNSV